jgi:hypothetical protein
MHVQLQTWAPYAIQVYVNGRAWLARIVRGQADREPACWRGWFRLNRTQLFNAASADPLLKQEIHELWWAAYCDEPGPIPPPDFDPTVRSPGSGRASMLEVRQCAEELLIADGTVSEAREAGGRPLGWIRRQGDIFIVEPRSMPRSASFWASGSPPPWASDWGRDEFGAWVAFIVEGVDGTQVSQRLRWIPPGRFLMGSPENEPERWNDEGPQHTVTIAKGFWLFDTACTQALWQAVMGDNPSPFKDPE